MRGEREADGGAKRAPRGLGSCRSFATKCSGAPAPRRASMSTSEIRSQTDRGLKMLVPTGAQDRFCINEGSGLGRSCKKKEKKRKIKAKKIESIQCL